MLIRPGPESLVELGAVAPTVQWAICTAVPGQRPITDIEPSEALKVLRAVEERGAQAIAKRPRQKISAILRFAVASDRAKADPAENLKGALKPPKTRQWRRCGRQDLSDVLQRLNIRARVDAQRNAPRSEPLGSVGCRNGFGAAGQAASSGRMAECQTCRPPTIAPESGLWKPVRTMASNASSRWAATPSTAFPWPGSPGNRFDNRPLSN